MASSPPSPTSSTATTLNLPNTPSSFSAVSLSESVFDFQNKRLATSDEVAELGRRITSNTPSRGWKIFLYCLLVIPGLIYSYCWAPSLEQARQNDIEELAEKVKEIKAKGNFEQLPEDTRAAYFLGVDILSKNNIDTAEASYGIKGLGDVFSQFERDFHKGQMALVIDGVIHRNHNPVMVWDTIRAKFPNKKETLEVFQLLNQKGLLIQLEDAAVQHFQQVNGTDDDLYF